MAADANIQAKVYRKENSIEVASGGSIVMHTGAKLTFNSTQLPAVEAATTAATSSLAGAITAINTLGGLFNDLKANLVSLGIQAST